MPRVARLGNNAPTNIGAAPSAGIGSSLTDTSAPATWTLWIWFGTILLLALMYFSL